MRQLASRAATSRSQSQPFRTLLIFLLLQGLLLTVNLKLLPMWGPEAGRTAASSPLYFWLGQGWLKIAHGGEDPLVWLRLLSAMFAIGSTIAIDRLWLRHAAAGVREWFLLLWTFSPCLLLFGRMARPYSLEVLLGAIAVWCAIELAKDAAGWKRMAAFAAAVTALLYTDFVAGLAVWAGTNALLVMWTRRVEGGHWKSWLITNLLPNALISAVYFPWLLRGHAEPAARLAEIAWTEPVVKAASWFYTFAFGGAVPVWLLAASALLAGPCVWLLYAGIRAQRKWAIAGGVAALVTLICALFWVAVPLMGARLLFLLPAYVLAVAAGIESRGRIGTITGMLLFAANLAGVWAYFGGRDFVNPEFLFPSQRIAAAMAILSSPEDTAIWIDGTKIDAGPLRYYLPKNFRIRELTTPESAAQARAELESANVRHLWFVRSTASAAFEPLEHEMNKTWYNHTVRPYVPVTASRRVLLQVEAWLRRQHDFQAPRYAYEVWEYARPTPVR